MESGQATGSRQGAGVPARSRSGSETRRRTERLTLRLLPNEHERLQSLADERGLTSVQALILDALQPMIATAS